tara:strand:- start:278 stop:1243 length:966 start_codon:yes stop_codon:yes gene_type:complete
MKILAIQNRMGIGDMIIYLPFIEAIAKKFSTKVDILVKKSSKASEILKENKFINEIINLDRNNRNREGVHDGIFGSFSLANQLKIYKFQKVFIFNSSLRYKLICNLASIKDIYQYPLFEKKNQHIILAAQDFIKNSIGEMVKSEPIITINEKSKIDTISRFKITKKEKNIILGIGGSGDTKRIPSKIFLKFMEKCNNEYNCRFFLATGSKDEEQNILKDILNSRFKSKCFSLEKMSLSQTFPLIANCDIAICNDSSFSHLSAAIRVPTIVLMADTPLLYGSYSSKMFPIIPDGETTVNHDTLGKDKIDPQKIFEKFKDLIN